MACVLGLFALLAAGGGGLAGEIQSGGAQSDNATKGQDVKTVDPQSSDAQKVEAPGKGDPLHPRVKLETTLGDIVLELDAEKAPATVGNFVQYVEDKFYDGTVFHRIRSDFMIQAGGYTVELNRKTDGVHAPIKNEWDNGLKHVRGTIAMARKGGTAGPEAWHSATCQFFINVVDNARLDVPRDGAGYCVFGKVVEGMDTVDKIRNTPVRKDVKVMNGMEKCVPVESVVVKTAKLTSAYDRKMVQAIAKKAEAAENAGKAKAEAERKKKMLEAVKKFEKEAGKKAVTTDSGLVYIVLKEGEGPRPKPTDSVRIQYTGWLLDGTQFDTSFGKRGPGGTTRDVVAFSLNRVIKGWTEGVGLMNTGAKHKLIIPPELAYGAQRKGEKIPPNSVLVFDVELVKIN